MDQKRARSSIGGSLTSKGAIVLRGVTVQKKDRRKENLGGGKMPSITGTGLPCPHSERGGVPGEKGVKGGVQGGLARECLEGSISDFWYAAIAKV